MQTKFRNKRRAKNANIKIIIFPMVKNQQGKYLLKIKIRKRKQDQKEIKVKKDLKQVKISYN